MFLIDAIKPKVEKKLKLVLFCATDCLGEVSQNKTSFVCFRFRFAGGNKIFILKNEKTYYIIKTMSGIRNDKT